VPGWSITDEFVRDPGVIEVVKKVKPVRITPPEEWGAAEVKVKLIDGREFSARTDKARGTTGNPATREEIKDKFWANVDFCKTLSPVKAKKVLTMLENLEKIDDVNRIVKLLVA
jgi:2-methylcitrate dehydratase PrpD